MPKRLFFVVCTIALFVLFVFPCTGVNAQDAGAPITIWHAYAGQQDKVDFINYAIESFKEKYPEIQFEEVPMEHSSYKTKLNTAMAAGNPPDVFYTLPGGYLGAFVKGGQIYQLDDELAKDGWGDSFIPTALSSVQFDGKTYGVPIDIDAAAIWYNKKVFEEHQWSVPETEAEFDALCEEIKAAGLIPVALGNKDRWPATFYFQTASLRFNGPGMLGKYASEPESDLFKTAAVKPFEWLNKLATNGYLPIGFNGMSEAEANILFINGQAAMMVNGTWQIGMTNEADKEIFELGFFGFPKFEGGYGDQSDVVAGVAASFAISEKAENKEACILFLRHLTSMDVMKKYVEMRSTMVAVKDATSEDVAGPVLYEVTKNLIEKAASMDAFYDTIMAPLATETYYTVIQGVLDGTISATDAAARLDEALRVQE